MHRRREGGNFHVTVDGGRVTFFDNKPIAFRARNRSLQSQEIIIDPQDIINKGSKDLKSNSFFTRMA